MPRLFPFSIVLAVTLSIASLPAQGGLRWAASGGQVNDEFGASVSNIGDVNGDGRPDVLVGAPYDDSNGTSSGRVWVLSGLDGSVIRFVDGTSNEAHGSSVDVIGDIDSDGVDDFVAGAAAANGQTGKVIAWSGATGALIHSINGTVAGGWLGTSVGAVGDVNGDNIPDFAAGAPGAWNEATLPGTAYVFSGADGTVIHSWTGQGPGHRFGFAGRTVGDVDMDGVPDIGVGAIKATFAGWRSGRAYVYSGATGNLIHFWDGDNAFDELGHDISEAGDLDGDGRDDVLVAADNRTGASYVRVRSGLDGTVLRQFNGFNTDFGHSCDFAGDVDGDGVQDYVVGAPQDSTNGLYAGAVHFFSGATGLLLRTVHGDAANDRLGYVVRGSGDVNGDGFNDVIAGTSYQDGRPGQVKVSSVMAAQAFGAATGPQSLSLAWTPGPAGSLPAGLGVVSGGTPGAAGTVGFTLGTPPASPTNVCGVDILIDLDPALLGLLSFTFSAQGDFQIPVDLANPYLNDVTVYAQAITGTLPQCSASAGLLLHFAP